MAPLTEPFRTIVADPPWPYKDRLPGGGRGAAKHYELMTLEQIESWGPAMHYLETIANDAHLYLWCTNAFVEQAHGVARAWGFEPKTLITWVKVKEIDQYWNTIQLLDIQLGMGYDWRGATEHVLFAKRGKLRTAQRNVPTVFFAPRGKHSEKPEEFYSIVERMSPSPCLELFARKRREGWTCWGKEIE